MRIGIIGVGRIGATHAHTLRQHPEVSSLVLCDADAERARDVGARLGGEALVSVEQAMDDGLDGVVIASASETHVELVSLALERRLPVFCEKPIAPDVKGALALAAETESAGVAVQVGFQRRFDDGYAAARRLLANGTIGELRRVHALTADPAPPPAELIAGSGGIYRDCLIHDFDALRFVTQQEVVEVHAIGVSRGSEVFRQANDVDETVVLLTLADGTLVTCHGSRYNGAGYDARMELAGTQGTVAVGLDAHAALSSAQPGETFPDQPPHDGFHSRFLAAYGAEMRAFVEVVKGAESLCTVGDGLEALYIAEAATISRQEGRTVRVEEVRA